MDFLDNMDGTLELDICDNADGRNIIVNILTEDGSGSIGIALSAEQAFAAADLLRMLAAGLDG